MQNYNLIYIFFKEPESPSESESEDEIPERCPNVNPINSFLEEHMPDLQTLKKMSVKTLPRHVTRMPLNPAIQRHVNLHQGTKVSINVLEKKSIGFWVEHVPAEENQNFRFRCKICRAFLEENNRMDRPSSYLITSPLMTAEGMLHKTKDENNEAFKKHRGDLVHIDAADFLDECTGIGEERINTCRAIRQSLPPQERYWAATCNLFKAAVSFIHTGAALTNWQTYTRNSADINAYIGFFHQTQKGLKKIMKTVIEVYKQRLIAEIKKGNPFSIIIDTFQVIGFEGWKFYRVVCLLLH